MACGSKASAKDCLTWMFTSNLIVPGTLVRYDDWHDLPDNMKAHVKVKPRRVRPSDVADFESDDEDREGAIIAARNARMKAC